MKKARASGPVFPSETERMFERHERILMKPKVRTTERKNQDDCANCGTPCKWPRISLEDFSAGIGCKYWTPPGCLSVEDEKPFLVKNARLKRIV